MEFNPEKEALNIVKRWQKQIAGKSLMETQTQLISLIADELQKAYQCGNQAPRKRTVKGKSHGTAN